MIIFDVLIWLAMAKIAVMILEDGLYAARGKPSPRRQALANRRAAEAGETGKASKTDKTSAPARPGTVGSAIGGYFAGLIEDATATARARRRREQARRQGAKNVDGVFVDVDEDGFFYADCDVCGWTSRRFRIEANAAGAGREHTRTEHPDQYTGETKEAATQDTNQQTDPGTETPQQPKLTLLRGGAEDPEASSPEAAAQPADPQPAATEPATKPAGPSSVVHPGDHTYCLDPGCVTCGRDSYSWSCRRCGTSESGYLTQAAAQSAGRQHTCDPTDPRPDDDAADRPQLSEADRARIRSELYGLCGFRDEVKPGFEGVWCDNPASDGPYCIEHSLNPDSTTSTNTTTVRTEKENDVNFEAAGPEVIRSAFTDAAQAAEERAEEVGGIAGVLTEAADAYEALQMADSTVGHLRDAAEAFSAAQASLNTAQEELQAALADFNAKDGQVADTVAETGGNVADKQVLVG